LLTVTAEICNKYWH